MSERAALPDLDTLNPEALKALIVTQHEQLLSKEEQLASRDEEIERLKLLIAKLRRMQFGRKSEKLDWQIEQLELKLDERTRPANTDCDLILLMSGAQRYSYPPWSFTWSFTRSGKNNAKPRARFANGSASRTP